VAGPELITVYYTQNGTSAQENDSREGTKLQCNFSGWWPPESWTMHMHNIIVVETGRTDLDDASKKDQDIKQYISTRDPPIMTHTPKISALKKATFMHIMRRKVPHLHCFDVTKPRYSA